ncbi:Fic family protein [Candidatus Nitrotoga fabula]|uniref:Fic family protein n=1 Tax=Candidatus Nitrotoga fabula TaxID=2182327 RepID=UPI003B9682FD
MLSIAGQEDWMRYERLLTAKKQKIIKESAKYYHGFLQIHYFINGNGRSARFILA